MDNGIEAASQNEIVIRDLAKAFDEVTAVNNLKLEVCKGEMFGFLGPNDRENHHHQYFVWFAGSFIRNCLFWWFGYPQKPLLSKR